MRGVTLLVAALALASATAARAASMLVADYNGLAFVDPAAAAPRLLSPTKGVIDVDTGNALYGFSGLAKALAGGQYWLSANIYPRGRIYKLDPVAGSADLFVDSGEDGVYFEDIAVARNGKLVAVTECVGGTRELLEVKADGTLRQIVALSDCGDYYDAGIRAPDGGSSPFVYLLYLDQDYLGRYVKINTVNGQVTVLKAASEELRYYQAYSLLNSSDTAVEFIYGAAVVRYDVASDTITAYVQITHPTADGLYGFSLNAAAPAPAGCVATDSVACLLGDRFKIDVTYGASSKGQQVPINAGTAAFAFGSWSSQNYDVFIKVINDCAASGRYHVYATGYSTQPVKVNVNDTRSGKKVTLKKPNGRFSALTNTSTFTCN